MIRRIEEMSSNAWSALQNVFEDGWILRFSEGYTKRANSVLPIYDCHVDVERNIKKCEAIYFSKKLDTVFKMTSEAVPKNLDSVLEQSGYSKEAPTSVQLCELDTWQECTEDPRIAYTNDLTEEWTGNFCRLSNIKDDARIIMEKMLGNIVPKKFFITMKSKEKIIGCGLAVLEDNYIGLFDIVIDAEYRGMGYGKILAQSMISIGKSHGAKTAYLQVVVGNEPAEKLYSSIGFKEIYKYWYRVKKFRRA